MTVKEYTKEFYRLDIRSKHVDDDVEKIVRYINGLRSEIQDEISFLKLESVEEAYQYALKDKEILTKKHEQRQRGRGGRFLRGRGRSYGEGGRSKNYVQDKRKFEWKNDDKGKIEWKGGDSYREGTVLTEEEVILILEVDVMVIVSDVVKRDIDILNVDPLKVGMIIGML